MQKATIFTIFFSILVVTLVAELLTSNHLRSGWTAVLPPSASSETSTPVPPETATAPAQDLSTPGGSDLSGSFIQPTPEAPATPDSPTGEVAQFISQTSYRLQSITSEQLQNMGFSGMRLEQVSTDGLLFQIIDVADVVNLSKIRFNLTDGKNIYGVLTEFLLADAPRAASFYDTLKQKASAFEPDIKVNEVKVFGSGSFYMNDSKRLGTAFLTVLSGNRVYTFSYPKASHDFFKKVVNLLANQK